MTVFGHGRLRLYLLKLLADEPRHGYELIRLLETRFLGRYAPSAGTIYPRLQRLEAEGLVTHTAVGSRKTYQITDAGRAELRRRAAEVVALESDICTALADLAATSADTRADGCGSTGQRERREAARQATRRWWEPPQPAPGGGAHRFPAAPPPPVAPPPPTRPPGTRPPGSRDAAIDFDRRLTAFTAEVRALVRRARLSDAQLHAATRALDRALDGLRRILR